MPTTPIARPSSSEISAAHLRRAQHRGDRDKREQHDRQVGRRAEGHRESRDRRGERRQQDGADGAGDERADGRGGQRLRGSAGFGHLVALDRGDHRRRLARCVQQDRRGRAAVHAAVEDAREHDERRAGADVVGDGQQQRHRHRRADTRQHADGGAQQHSDHGVQQVHRRGGFGEPLQQPVEVVHLQNPVQDACGQRDSEPGVERVEAADRQHRADQRCCARSVCCPAPWRSRRRTARSAIAQPSGTTSTISATNNADQQADGAPVAGHVGIDVLAGIGLALGSARDRDRQHDRHHQQADADDDRKEPGPNGIHLGVTAGQRHARRRSGSAPTSTSTTQTTYCA